MTSRRGGLAAFALAGLALAAACRSGGGRAAALPEARHDLVFERPAEVWDEGIPLGNGLVGALVWQRAEALRFSLDRADLWDLRPVAEFEGPEFRFGWVRERVLAGDYEPVHRMGDVPYDRDPAPTKIPAGALEFESGGRGGIVSVRLALAEAVCTVAWKDGAALRTFVHAVEPVGWFAFDGAPEDWTPRLVPPAYAAAPGADADVVAGKTLASLGYPAPNVTESGSSLLYRQEGWGGMVYEIAVSWERTGAGRVVGAWSIGCRYPGKPESGPDAAAAVRAALERTFAGDFKTHAAWWADYWSRSSIRLPDPVLEKQWFLETYKFGAASRRGAPPITLQAVWTADNGSLPPWKGDFHHDLNTQLSYWPCYSGNRLEEGLSFLDWLWAIKPEAERYTSLYFGVPGLNVPGVSTLEGRPMGGWIQYSLGPTVSAWLAHHFYLHWAFSRDREFLTERAYPWIEAVAVFLEALSERREDGKRHLPLSSSPEINDNRIEAWFRETTNYDLALIRWLFGAAAELAGELGRTADAERWRSVLAEWPELARAGDDGRLLVAPGLPLRESHRHFSHLMAIHPLGLVDRRNGGDDLRTISASLAELDRLGPDWWCGYSYAWLGNLAARAGEGERAARALRIFAACFCLPNSFHANGDQCRAGHSRMTYRPFTLEGNFAFAAAVQEMLLQSHAGAVRVFPAVPESWVDVSFENLRARGAFLVSAARRDGRVVEVRVLSERGGTLVLENPFAASGYRISGPSRRRVAAAGGLIRADLGPGDALILRDGR